MYILKIICWGLCCILFSILYANAMGANYKDTSHIFLVAVIDGVTVLRVQTSTVLLK